MTAVDEYHSNRNATSTPGEFLVSAKLADAAIAYQEDNIKSILAIARRHIPPEDWHFFCDDLRSYIDQLERKEASMGQMHICPKCGEYGMVWDGYFSAWICTWFKCLFFSRESGENKPPTDLKWYQKWYQRTPRD